MSRSYIDSLWYILGAYSGLLIGISREGLFLVKSLTTFNGWKQIYVGAEPRSQKKIDYGDAKPIHASSATAGGPAEIASYLGTRPSELETPKRRVPVYSSTPMFGNSPVEAEAPATSMPSSPSLAPYAGQQAQAMPFSLPLGTPSQPVFDRPATPPASSPAQKQPLYERPSTPLANSPVKTQPLSAAAPSFSPTTTSPTSSAPPRYSTAPTFAAPTLASVAPPSGPVAPISAPTAATSLSVSPPAAPVAATEANRSPTNVSEDFTDDDMSSTVEEIADQPISNAGKIKKLRKRISSKLKGVKN